MTPTVGRIVYYKSFGTPGGEFPSVDRAAIVTQVHNATCIDLCVLNPTGMYFSQNVFQGPDPGQWDWMPFQKQKTVSATDKLPALYAFIETTKSMPQFIDDVRRAVDEINHILGLKKIGD